jgi:hypothetical protein
MTSDPVLLEMQKQTRLLEEYGRLIRQLVGTVTQIRSAMQLTSPNYRYPLRDYRLFDWERIGAEVISHDDFGPTAVEWGGFRWLRRNANDKKGTAVWFSRHTEGSGDNASYATLVKFTGDDEVERIPDAIAPALTAPRQTAVTQPPAPTAVTQPTTTRKPRKADAASSLPAAPLNRNTPTVVAPPTGKSADETAADIIAHWRNEAAISADPLMFDYAYQKASGYFAATRAVQTARETICGEWKAGPNYATAVMAALDNYIEGIRAEQAKQVGDPGYKINGQVVVAKATRHFKELYGAETAA